MDYGKLLKRANKAIDRAKSKLNHSKVHLVDDEADIAKLSGLIIILNSATSKLPRISTQAKQELADSDF